MTRSMLAVIFSTTVAMGATQIREENDAFIASDRGYTQGLEIRNAQPWVSAGDWRVRSGWSVLNVVSTPSDILLVRPDPSDRPYAGLTAASWHLTEASAAHTYEHRVLFGVVGPAAGSDRLQTRWHDTFGFAHPSGWAYQLQDEPALNYYGRSHQRIAGSSAWDAGAYAMGAIGTVHDYAGGGLTCRVGYNLPEARSPMSVEASAVRGRLRAYLECDGSARYVAHNTLIDGSLMRTGPGVDSNDVMFEHTVGAVVGYVSGAGKEYSVGFSRVQRSSEFDGQQGRTAYGAVTIRVAW